MIRSRSTAKHKLTFDQAMEVGDLLGLAVQSTAQARQRDRTTNWHGPLYPVHGTEATRIYSFDQFERAKLLGSKADTQLRLHLFVWRKDRKGESSYEAAEFGGVGAKGRFMVEPTSAELAQFASDLPQLLATIRQDLRISLDVHARLVQNDQVQRERFGVWRPRRNWPYTERMLQLDLESALGKPLGSRYWNASGAILDPPVARNVAKAVARDLARAALGETRAGRLVTGR